MNKNLFSLCIPIIIALLTSCGATTTTDATRDIIPTGAMAQMLLLTLAPERLAALSSALSEEELAFLPAEIANLPVLGTINGDMGTAQVEELLLCNPTYIIDVGTTTDDTLATLETLTDLTGIQTIHVSASIATMADVYTQLGAILDLEERGDALATYCQQVYQTATVQASAISDGDRHTVLYAQGDNGLYVISRDSLHSEVLDLWCDNVAILDIPTQKGLGDAVDMEQILNWNPEIIFFGPDSIYDTVADDPLWQSITAIQTGQYYQIPNTPYNWLGMPASINTYLGLQWIGSVLYEQDDFYDTMAEYMALFYNYALTQEMYDALFE